MKIDEKLVEQIARLVLEEIQKSNKTITLEDTKFTKNKILKNQYSLNWKENSNSLFEECGKAQSGIDVREVVIGIAPAFGNTMKHSIAGLNHIDIVREVMAGIEEEGMKARVVRVIHTSDVSFVGKACALLSGSGIAIGIQSKGTSIIHQKDLYPLTNLELFPQAPLITLDMYRQIGKNAAKYAKGVHTEPILMKNDPMVRASYQVKAAIMHIKETELVMKNAMPVELKLKSVI